MDSENYITFLLIDKEYYDYDYSAKEIAKEITIRERTDEEVAEQAKKFGFGNIKPSKRRHTIEEMQQIAMQEISANTPNPPNTTLV